MRALLTGGLTLRTRILVLVEHVLVVVAVTMAVQIRAGGLPSWNELPDIGVVWRASLVAAVFQGCLHLNDLYDLRHTKDRRTLVTGLIQATGTASIILALVYALFPGLVIGHGVVVVASGFIILLISSWRIAFDWLSLRLEPNERLLIVGTAGAAVDLARELYDRRQELGVELVGFVDTDASLVGTSLINPGVIGVIQDIPTIVRERRVDRVVVSLADARGKLSMAELLRMKLNDGVRFDHLASVYEAYTGKIAVENLRPSWLIFSDGFEKRQGHAIAKRIADILLATVGLLLALPLMAVAAIAVRMSSPGSALYHQVRVGKDGRPFTIHKFRSMRSDAEAGTGAVWAVAGDPRVTPVGRFLRRTRIDELPQLWNVLKGEMSFVGPRPERPEFVSELTAQIPFYGQRHVVCPGLTGWAQVRHEYGSTVEDAIQKLQYELFYIKHMSLWFDLFIAFETVKTVLVRRGS
jgi:sugar transferase (PEP-CTERM system associated)